MPLRKDSKVEEKGPKIAISGVSTDKIKGETQTDENSTAVKTAQTESLVKNEVVQSLRAPKAFPERQTCSFTDVLKCKDGGISNFPLRKSEGDILGTELMDSTRHHEHEPSVKECIGQRPHIYIYEEEFDETDENVKSSINQTESEVKKALETLQTESEVASEAFQSKSCSKSSVGSTISPVRRVSSLTDLLRWNERRKSSLRRSKSEAGSVSSSKALVKDRTAQQLLYISENEEEPQSDKTVGKYSPTINPTEPEVTGAGNKIGPKVKEDDQCRSVFVLRSLPNEQRRRSLSDSTTLNTPRISTAEYLRETQSYTTFPHIDTQSAPRDDKLSSFVHRTSCFRIMPHLSGDCLADENFPTISVLSLSSLFEDYAQNIECEISSESEEELGTNVESLLHSWRKPSSRPRSYSEPVSKAPELPVKTWSLPDMKENRLLRFEETIYKVKASPSRLQFREQGLEKLKEETSFLSGGLSFESVKSCSSSVMSLVDNYDNEVIDQWLSSQERLGGDEVMGRWINRPRRNSITKQPSFSMVEEAKEERQSAVSLVNQVTEQVLSSCDVDISSESNDDQLTTVEAAVKLWKEKDAGRRVTLASVSPLTDSPKYASEIEQQAFRKIKKWKDSFALKLNNVLGERFQEMAAKRDEELARKKKPKVLNVPMNLTDKEMGQLKNNLLLELKKKSVGSNDHEDLAHVPPLPALPIPRVKYPRRASSDQTPTDLRAQMMKELSRRVSVAGDDEDALHCYKPSSLVPGLSKTLLQTNRQGVVYIPSGIRSTTLDPDTIRDLLSWHEAERERLKAELEGLPQAQSGEKQVLIDRNDANKVLQSMMKIMEEIFTGTIMRLMGLGEPGSNVEPTENEETKQTEVCQIKEDDIDEPDSEAVKPGKDLKLDTDVRNLSASGSTENLSSQSIAELLSSASSLTGISFSSSNDSFGICDQLKDGRASAAMKDKTADMSTNSSNVECRSASLEDAPECATSSVSPRIKECNSVLSSHILPSVAKAEALDNNQLARMESIELLLADNQGNLIKGMLVTDMEVPRKQFLKSLKAPEETGCYCNTMINCLDAKEPRKSITQNSGTIGKNDENHIRKLQAALQEETESENLLKQRLLSLENELNSAVNNSNYWFSQCVKKREKIEELVSNARDMNSANFELRQEIDIKSRTIYEKDQEIQRLTESKTETEILLQEVKENLFKSNEEIERLKLFIGKLNEEELRSVQTSQFLQVEALKPTTLYEKSWESHMSRKNYEKENFNATHKGAESDKLSCCIDEVLSSEVQNSKYHFGPISSYNVVTRPSNTCNASVCGNNVISQSRDERGRKEMFGAPLSNEPCSLLDNPILNDPEKTKTAIGEWLSKVIRQAKAKLSRERKSVSFSEKTYTDGRLKCVANEKENARSSLREVVSSFKGKISKDVPGLPKKRKKNVPTHSTGPITGEHNRQKTHRSKESVLKGCYEWSRNDTKVDNSFFALVPMDKRDDSLLNLAADVSTDTLDSMEPFADVFPANFEATDVLLAHGIDSVEPFCEVLIPWQNSKDAGVKKTIEAFKRSITKAKQHPGKKANLDKFLLGHGAESITLEEKKGTAQTAVAPAGSEELVFRNINDCSLKRVHPERKPKHVTEENTANIDKTSVIKKRQEKPILDKKVERSIYNRQNENRTPKQNRLDNYVQSSSVTQPRTFFDSVDGTQRDYSPGLVTGKNLFSNESSTVKRDVERLIAELDSKTKNYTKFQKKQQSSPEKVLQLKLNDSKLVPSSGSKITLSNNNGFIDAISIDIKLNKEQLMNEFVHGAMMNPQQPQEKITTLKAGKETHFTTNEHYMPDRLKNVALQRLNQQRKERSVPFLCEKQDISADVCKQTNSFGTEFTQQRRIDTQRWISDMLKGVGSLETTSELTDKDQGKVRDKSEVKHQNRESNSLPSIRHRVLHGSSRKPASPLMCKQNISKPKAWQTPKITLGQSAKNEIFKETECSKRNAWCGSNRGQQRKAESDVRIAMWQAKNGCLGGMLKETNIQDGLVDKFSERPKLAKPWTEASQLAKQTMNLKKCHIVRDLSLYASTSCMMTHGWQGVTRDHDKKAHIELNHGTKNDAHY